MEKRLNYKGFCNTVSMHHQLSSESSELFLLHNIIRHLIDVDDF